MTIIQNQPNTKTMMKRILLAAAVMMSALSFQTQAQTARIGLVDKDAIVQAMPETAEAQQKFTDASLRYKEQQSKLEQEMREVYENYRNMPANELPAIRDQKTRLFTDQQQKMQKFEEEVQADLQQMQRTLMAPIYTRIQEAVQQIGREGGYSVILDKNENVLYYPDAVDLTPLVRERLGIR